MLFQPIEEIVPRTIEDPEIRAILSTFSDAIADMVNLGSHVLKWGSDCTTGGDEKAPRFLMLRYVLDLLDAISILVKHSSADPAKLLVRGLLEACFQLEYLIKADADERGAAFMFWHYNEKLKQFQAMDPSTDRGKKLQKALSSDRQVSGMSLNPRSDLQARTLSIEGLLKGSLYSDATAAYQQLRGGRQKNPPWYQLCDSRLSTDICKSS
jgi:hypothetical protein